MQGLNLTTKSLNDIVYFWNILETAKEILHDKGYVSHPNKNPGILVIDTNHLLWIR